MACAVKDWDVSRVTNFANAFRNAESFNEDLSAWDVSAGTNFNFMFKGATSFNSDLTSWDLSGAQRANGRISLTVHMLDGATAFDCALRPFGAFSAMCGCPGAAGCP